MLCGRSIAKPEASNAACGRRRLFSMFGGLACAAMTLAVAAPRAWAFSTEQWHTAAALAEAAYPKKQGILYRRVMKRFPRVGKLVQKPSGFAGGIFEGKTVVYVAFAGTDDLRDGFADKDIAFWFGKNRKHIKQQVSEAKALAREAINRYSKSKSIIVVGHSLGGYLAQAVTAELNVDAGFSFNGPGFGLLEGLKLPERRKITPLVWKGPRKTRKMTNLVRERDPIGNYGIHFGETLIIHDAVSDPTSIHGITAFRKDLLHGMEPYRVLVSGSAEFRNSIVRSQDSRKCIQVAWPVTEGKNARIRNCDGKKWNQRWTLRGNGIMHLTSVEGKDAYKPRCLEARKGKKGAAIQVGECHGLENQRWVWSNGRIRGKSGALKDMCVDVKRAKDRSGTGLILWPCHNRSNQKWTAEKAK